jgi:hypothetical protein
MYVLVATMRNAERLRCVRNMRGRMSAAVIINPRPRRGSVRALKWISPKSAVLPDCAEIPQHPLLILQSLR